MGAPNDLPTQAALPITPELVALLDRESQALVEAQDFQITDSQTAVMVNDQLMEVKRRQEVVKQWDERFAAPIRQLEQTRKAFFGPAKQALEGAESYLKGLLKGWTEREQKRIADEKQRALDVARQLREEAERKAAAERARAEEAARKAREEAAAAEAKRKAAEEAARQAREAGDRRAAAEAEKRAQAAAAEAAKKQAEEQQRIAEGERKAQEAQLAAAAAPAPAAVAEAPKLAGLSFSKNWVAELAPGTTEEQAKEMIVRAVCGIAPNAALPRGDLLALLSLDMAAAKKLAKAQEGRFSVPGLTARNDPTPRSSKKGG
jgi:hypothetical protein